MDIPLTQLDTRSHKAPHSSSSRHSQQDVSVPHRSRSAGNVYSLANGSPNDGDSDALQQGIAAARRTAETLKRRVAVQKEALADTTLRAVGLEKVPALSPGVQMRVRKTLKGHLSKIYALAWARDSRLLMSVGQDAKVIIWDAYTSNKLHALRIKIPFVMDCAFSPDQRLIATGGLQNSCFIYRLPDLNNIDPEEAAMSMMYPARPARVLEGHEAFMSQCRFVTDREILTSSGDRSCVLWDIERGKWKERYFEHSRDVMGLDLSPAHASIFVTGGCDGLAKVWDRRVESAKGSVQSFHAHDADINTVRMFPDGNAFATGSEDATCKLFDLRADCALAAYSNNMLTSSVQTLDFTKSGRYLIVGYDEPEVQVWDTLRTDRVGALLGHESRVSRLKVSPDGRALCTGSWDARMLLWTA